MNELAIVIIIGMIGMVILKNKEKVMEIIDKIRNISIKDNDGKIELSKREVDKLRLEQIKELEIRKNILQEEIKSMNKSSIEEIAKIDIKLYLLKK